MQTKENDLFSFISYNKNEPINITFKSLDTNNLERKILLKIHLTSISSLKSTGFIPETYFEQEILFHNQSTQTFTVPSNLLPTGKYFIVVEAKFLTTGNKTNTKSLSIIYNNEPPLFITKLDTETLSINLLRSDTTSPIKSKLIGYQNKVKKIEKEIDYNTTIPLNQNIDRYQMIYGLLNQDILIPHQVLISMKRTKKGLLQYKIENPHHIPISYSIFKDKNLFFIQDTCNQSIEKTIKHSKKHHYCVNAHFIWDGKLIKLTSSDFLVHKNSIKVKRKLDELKLETLLSKRNKNAQTTYSEAPMFWYDRKHYDLYSKYNDDNPYELNDFYINNSYTKLVDPKKGFYEPTDRPMTKTEQLLSKFKSLKKNELLFSYDSIENKSNYEFIPLILDSQNEPMEIYAIYIDGKLTPFKDQYNMQLGKDLSLMTLPSQVKPNHQYAVEIWTKNKIYTLTNILFKPGMKLNLVFSELIKNKQVKCKQRVLNPKVFIPDYETSIPKTRNRIQFLYPSFILTNYDYICLFNQRNNKQLRIYNYYLKYDDIHDLDTGLYKLVLLTKDKKQFYLDSIHLPKEGTYYLPKDTKPKENQSSINIDFYSVDEKKLTTTSENLGSIYGNFTPAGKYNYTLQLMKQDTILYTFKTNKKGYFEFVNIVPDTYQLKINNNTTHTSTTTPITLKKDRITVLKNMDINLRNNVVTFELLYSGHLHTQLLGSVSVE